MTNDKMTNDEERCSPKHTTVRSQTGQTELTYCSVGFLDTQVALK
jgi:hypothetical protein